MQSLYQITVFFSNSISNEAIMQSSSRRLQAQRRMHAVQHKRWVFAAFNTASTAKESQRGIHYSLHNLCSQLSIFCSIDHRNIKLQRESIRVRLFIKKINAHNAGADWQAVWQPGGRRNAAGVMADNLLWYHLLGITRDSNSLFKCKCLYLYISWGGWLPASSPSYLFIFLLFIYNNPDGLF